MSEAFTLDLHTYLGRLGYSSAPPPTLDTLRDLQARHTAEFPFETLANMLGMAVEVAPAAIQEKLLRQGRGGYCFELNRLYLLLLQALGFEARGLTGRVVMGGPEDRSEERRVGKESGARWETWYELQNHVNERVLERKLRTKPSDRW